MPALPVIQTICFGFTLISYGLANLMYFHQDNKIQFWLYYNYPWLGSQVSHQVDQIPKYTDYIKEIAFHMKNQDHIPCSRALFILIITFCIANETIIIHIMIFIAFNLFSSYYLTLSLNNFLLMKYSLNS